MQSLREALAVKLPVEQGTVVVLVRFFSVRLLSTLMVLVAGTSAASECNSDLVEWVCAAGPDRVVLRRTFAGGCQAKDLTSGVEEDVTCPPFDAETQQVTCERLKEVDLKASGFRLTVEPAGKVVGEAGVKLEDVELHRLVCPQRLTLTRNGAVVLRETANTRCLADGVRGEVRVDASAAPSGRLLVLVSVPMYFDEQLWCGEQRALSLAGLKSDRLVKAGKRGGLVAPSRPQKAEFAALVRRQALQACERGEAWSAAATFELATRFGAKPGTCAEASTPPR